MHTLLPQVLLTLVPLPLAPQAGPVPQAAINDAVDRGVEWLIASQRRDGSWGENDMTPGGHRDPRNDLTAFCTYTLLKCRVGQGHPAVRRALAFLEQGEPNTNYATSTLLMALAATGDERYEKRIRSLTQRLIDARVSGHDIWGYPRHPSIVTDLSNTQYAALGLRAAMEAGVSVPDKLWLRLVERVLRHQEEPRAVEDPEGTGTATTRLEAGFAYLLPDPANPSFGYNVPNASMTAAGLALLRIAEEGLGGKLPRSVGRAAERARVQGWAWLDAHFAAEKNDGGAQAWLYYYLYGIERVGALFGRDEIGGQDWYQAGARGLVKWQRTEGHWQQGAYQQWPRQPMPHANTCFALLFLVKATRASTTGEGQARESDVYSAEDPAAEVHVRASGRSTLTIWVSGFGDSVVEEFTTDSIDAKGMFVTEVRYLLDGEVVARVPGDSERPWKDQRYAVRHAFERDGAHELLVEVDVRDDGAEGRRTTLVSDPLTVRARDVLADWMLDYAAHDARERIVHGQVTATASSYHDALTAPDRAIDGLEASRWLSRADDPQASLTLEFRRPIRAGALVLAQADSKPSEVGWHSRVTRVAITINGARKALEVTLDDDALRPTRIEFPRRARLRRLSIQVLDRVGGREFPSAVGFSEVSLLD
ncbi:MAG: hypothetical protein QF903_00035 [Planctomycetota bacterium]|nr:hypothetical protein [Planctomycetota bacterium]MDP6761371.1 hypothetical protein [Planctomycetota bacterium]MDP6987846.1 hypothetical protein [Planctomycetota bacterium]